MKPTHFLLLAAMAAPAFAAPANLVTNGSFDADTVATKTRFEGNVSGWTGGARLTFLAPAGSADDLQQYLAVYGPFPATSPAGGNFILADGDPEYNGAFSQTITGLEIGKAYELTFYQAAGQQFGFRGPTTERWRVGFGDDSQLSSLFSLPDMGVGPWQEQTMRFTARAASQVLSFLAVGTPNGAPPISFLDGVSLQAAVPEPATWGLMVVGFGMAGIGLRRRRATLATA